MCVPPYVLYVQGVSVCLRNDDQTATVTGGPNNGNCFTADKQCCDTMDQSVKGLCGGCVGGEEKERGIG